MCRSGITSSPAASAGPMRELSAAVRMVVRYSVGSSAAAPRSVMPPAPAVSLVTIWATRTGLARDATVRVAAAAPFGACRPGSILIPAGGAPTPVTRAQSSTGCRTRT
jgi:hypothetical protein